MAGATDEALRRVYVPQALGADEFLRVTWHEHRQVMVFSHWRGAECVAATPVRISDVGELAELVVSAYTRTTEPTRHAWAPPQPADQVTIAESA